MKDQEEIFGALQEVAAIAEINFTCATGSKECEDQKDYFEQELMPAIAHLGLARAYLARKRKAAARAAIAEALRVEPGSAEALALKKKL